MTSFTIELDDELAQQLEARAAQTHLTPHEMAIVGLRNFLKNAEPESSTRIETLSDEEFQKVAQYTLEKNAELYRRLA